MVVKSKTVFPDFRVTKKVVLNNIFIKNISSHSISDSENFKGYKR